MPPAAAALSCDTSDSVKFLASKQKMERKSSSSPDGERMDKGSVATVDSERYESSLAFNPWNQYLAFRNARILTVEPVLFLYMFGRTLFIPLIQQYFFNLYALDELKNTSYPYFNKSMCLYKSDIDTYASSETYKKVEYHSNVSYMYIAMTSGILSIFSTMIMGPLSDKYGRRLVLILVSVGALIQGLNSLVVVKYNLSLFLLIPGVAISGIFGDFAAMIMASFSYISDVSSKERRTVRLGLVECTVFLAALLSGGLGGIWFKKVNCNLISPLLAIVGCNLVIIIYTLVLLPASIKLTANERKTRDQKGYKGFQLLARGCKIFLCMVKEYPVWKLWTALIAIVILLINLIGSFSIMVLFLKALNWGPEMIGENIAISKASHLVVLVVVLPVLVVLKLPDSLISLIGVIFCASMNLCMGLLKRPYQLFIGKVIMIIIGFLILLQPRTLCS